MSFVVEKVRDYLKAQDALDNAPIDTRLAQRWELVDQVKYARLKLDQILEENKDEN